LTELVTRHRTACDGFSRIAAQFNEPRWTLPTPCTEWDAAALVEHVIGFHEFLLLRPLGVRAHRPKSDPAARWSATSAALFVALDEPGAPHTMLAALTTDVLVHTWDLARAAALDPELCAIAYDAVRNADLGATGMYAPARPTAGNADTVTKLIAACGRNPAWTPARG
jgi:uncharacterized protein (TIGR03083 family)